VPVPVPELPLTPAVAVTVASTDVVNVTCAVPVASVLTRPPDKLPAEVANVTGTPCRALPFTSTTLAVIAEEPPVAGMIEGLAVRVMRPTAAEPTAILTAPFAPVVAPPEEAVIVAVPFAPFALNVTRA
jgi:hypothetical protein